MSNLGSLRDNEKFGGLSITEDYTVAERECIRSQVKEANEMNAKEPIDSEYIWKVRGSPKNGIRIMKLKKRKTTNKKQQSQEVN